jgi:SAM-dependent methyltransferase
MSNDSSVNDLREKEFFLYSSLEDRHWWFKGRRLVLKTFLKHIPEKDKKILLEIGCGTGGNLLFLFKDFQKRTGIDFDPIALKFAAAKVKQTETLLQGDANCIPMPENSFDCIAFLDLLSHRSVQDIDQVLRRCHGILKKNGYLLISDGAFAFLQGAHSRNVNAHRRFTRKELIAYLNNAGFQIVKASYWGGLLFFLLFLKRAIVEKLFPRKQHPSSSFDLVPIPILDSLLYLSIILEIPFHLLGRLPFGASVAILAKKYRSVVLGFVASITYSLPALHALVGV